MGLFDSDPVKAALREYLDLAKVIHTLIVAVTNLSLGSCDSFAAFAGAALPNADAFRNLEPNVWQLPPENYADAIYASAAIPPGFAPVPIDVGGDEPYMFSDGGLANNTPIRQALDAGATSITVVMLQHSGLSYRTSHIRDLSHVSLIGHDISQERTLELDLKLARRINEEVRRGEAPDRRFVDIRVIGPSVPLRLASVAFNNQPAIDRVLEQGRTDARAALGL